MTLNNTASLEINNTATPEIDAATPDLVSKRPWIPSRSCWCADDAKDDCRYHSSDERGWKVCPSKPAATSPIKPRMLWNRNQTKSSGVEE